MSTAWRRTVKSTSYSGAGAVSFRLGQPIRQSSVSAAAMAISDGAEYGPLGQLPGQSTDSASIPEPEAGVDSINRVHDDSGGSAGHQSLPDASLQLGQVASVQRRTTVCGGRRKTQSTVRDGLTTTFALSGNSDNGISVFRQNREALFRVSLKSRMYRFYNTPCGGHSPPLSLGQTKQPFSRLRLSTRSISSAEVGTPGQALRQPDQQWRQQCESSQQPYLCRPASPARIQVNANRS